MCTFFPLTETSAFMPVSKYHLMFFNVTAGQCSPHLFWSETGVDFAKVGALLQVNTCDPIHTLKLGLKIDSQNISLPEHESIRVDSNTDTVSLR